MNRQTRTFIVLAVAIVGPLSPVTAFTLRALPQRGSALQEGCWRPQNAGTLLMTAESTVKLIGGHHTPLQSGFDPR